MPLLGRDRERAALEKLLAAAREGRGGALVLRGEAGVGLSALLEHAVDSSSGMRVARVRGVKPEQGLEFAGVHQLCAPMVDCLDALPAVQRVALAAALGLVDGDVDVEDRRLLGLGVLTLVARMAQEQPLLCVVDDAQWLDASSAEALAFAARRLEHERVAFAFAVHASAAGGTPFAGIDELVVQGLAPDSSADLLRDAVTGPLDPGVRDRLVADTGGNPLALLELSGQLTPEQLAGYAALPSTLPVGDVVRERFLPRSMPRETQTLLLLAAADPDASASELWNAVATLGLSAAAATPAEAGGVLRIAHRVAFRHPLIRLAVYDSAPVAERQQVHRALVEALDPDVERDRAAWHRAAASLRPDEEVAGELEAAATRARGRGDYATAATLLERAAGLTPDADRRYARTLAAAQSALATGALGRAAALVDSASYAPLDELLRGHAQRLRGVIGIALGQGADRATTLVRAARALEPVDPRLARDSYLEALEAATHSARFANERSLSETAEAGRSAPRVRGSQASVADLLLDGLTLLITAGHRAAIPTLRRATAALIGADEPRWLALGQLVACEIWDDEALHDLTSRQAELTPAAGARAAMPFGLHDLGDLDAVVAGRFGAAAVTSAGIRESANPIWSGEAAGPISPANLLATAWRGRAAPARELAEECMRDAFARELGLHVAFAHLAIAVLEVGLGRYEAALTAARSACEAPGLGVVTVALPELIEAAVRAGEREVALAAVSRLSESTIPSGTDWALGTLARSRALLEQDARAEQLYVQAIERLRRSRAAPHLARAHLAYGEWLRRERRRRDAREQLRTARDMFSFMGAQAFADRARAELTATGESTRRQVKAPAEPFTEQEARIVRLVCEGATNAAIGAQLFISPRTVEYHLHKVFRKLGVSSRTQLARVMLSEERGDDTPATSSSPPSESGNP